MSGARLRGRTATQGSEKAREKSTKINFLGPETARWSGGLPREGVVAEKFVPSLESLSSLGFEERNLECPGNFAWMSRTPGGVQKVCAKKSSCAFFVSYVRRFWTGFWGRVLRRVRRGSDMGFTVKNGSEKGSQKGF